MDLLLRGTQEGSLTRHAVAWQRHPFSTPFPLASQPLDEAQSLLRLPSMPRVHCAGRAEPGTSETWRAPSKASRKPHRRESFSLFTWPRESDRAGIWDTFRILSIPVEVFNSGILHLISCIFPVLFRSNSRTDDLMICGDHLLGFQIIHPVSQTIAYSLNFVNTKYVFQKYNPSLAFHSCIFLLCFLA